MTDYVYDSQLQFDLPAITDNNKAYCDGTLVVLPPSTQVSSSAGSIAESAGQSRSRFGSSALKTAQVSQADDTIVVDETENNPDPYTETPNTAGQLFVSVMALAAAWML